MTNVCLYILFYLNNTGTIGLKYRQIQLQISVEIFRNVGKCVIFFLHDQSLDHL